MLAAAVLLAIQVGVGPGPAHAAGGRKPVAAKSVKPAKPAARKAAPAAKPAGKKSVAAKKPAGRKAAAVAAVGAAAIAAGARAGDGSAFAQALAAADKGDWRWAQRQAERDGAPLLGRYLRWRELLEGEPRPSFAAFHEFLAGGSDWPSLGTIQLRAEAAVDDDVSFAQRLAFFERLPPRTRQGRIRYAQALIAAGREAEAVRLLRQSWVEDNYSSSEESYFLDNYGSILRSADHAARLERLLWDERIDEARRMLGRVGSRERELALARLKLQLSDATVDAAIDAVPADLQRDPGLMFDRLRWRRQKGNYAGAAEILLKQPADLGQPQKWWREHERVIREAIDQRDFRLAYELASAHSQQQGAELAEAEWLSGWLALRFLDQPAAARRHFERMWPAVSTPISRGRAAYWAGRAAAQGGDLNAARAWYARAAAYPTAFYGQLAAIEIGVDVADRLDPVVRAPTAAREALQRRLPAQIAALFCARGQADHAQPFFRHMGYEARDDHELRAVIDLAHGCDRADLVLTVARAAASNGRHLIRDAYPVPRVRMLREVAGGLPEPALRLAVARQESLFNPGARSGAGALGLMQLMPPTAEAMAKEAGVPFSRTRLVTDPEYNARLGSTYLQRQLRRWDDEPALALAAYNAGPSRVVRWLAEHGDPRADRDPYRLIDWIELIPFSETRNYVQRVLEGRGMYRALLAGPKPKPGAATADSSSPVPSRKPQS